MRNPIRLRRRGVALAGAVCAGIALLVAPTASAAPTTAPSVPALDWQPCDPGFLCATATVPLDYADPTGPTIQLAVIKHPATDATHRIGSVFYYPSATDSGPSGSGRTLLPLLYARFPPDVRSRFDVVSFDPRGVGHSTDLQCFDTIDEENELVSHRPTGFPVDAAGARAWETVAGELDKACAAHAGPLLAHDTTADTARDLDLLRQAVGDKALNYVGTTYGTYLGATYANLFPDKVRAIALDGALDPVAWATGTGGSARHLGVFLREGSDEASAAALDAFLDLCGRAPTTACAFSAGTPAATRAKWATLLDRLASHPVTIRGTTFIRAVTVAVAVESLYSVQPIPNLTPGWRGLAVLLQTLWAQTSAPAPAATGSGATPSTDVPYRGRESQLGVICSDSPFPRNPTQYPAQAAFATARSGAVGPPWAWGSEGCSQWPILAPQRYTGPWNHRTAAPILVIGTTGNPHVPYRDAVAMTHDLANARLLTVHGYGNNTLGDPGACVAAAEDAYFVTGALPAPGTVCQQDKAPFTG